MVEVTQNSALLKASLRRLAIAEVGAILLLTASRSDIPVISTLGGFIGLFILAWASVEFFVCLWHYLAYRESLGVATASTYVGWTVFSTPCFGILIALAVYPPILFDSFLPNLFAAMTKPIPFYGPVIVIAATIAGFRISNMYPMRNWCVTASLGGLILGGAGIGWLGPISGIGFVIGAVFNRNLTNGKG